MWKNEIKRIRISGNPTPKQMAFLREAAGMQPKSLSLDPITYVLPMKKKITLAIAAVVLLGAGILLGYVLRGEPSDLTSSRTKATALVRYCQLKHGELAYLLKDIETPNRGETMTGATIVGIDNNLSLPDLNQIRPCFPESSWGSIPSTTFMCTRPFKNDDKCRIDALKKALDLFPDEYRGP